MNRCVRFAFIFVCLFSSSTFAKINPSLTGNELKNALQKEAQAGQHPVGYNQARKDVMGELYLEHENNSYFITDVYCESKISSKGPGYVPADTILNVEHTWPQSLFNGESGAKKSDLHHLFPSDPQMNSARGNNPFGIVVTPVNKALKCSTSKLGENAQGARVFEPPPAHRGNVARAIFYFAVRYTMTIDKVQESVLKQWNHEDPVDENEALRNDAIQGFQGNRNPFIDQPELIDAISIAK